MDLDEQIPKFISDGSLAIGGEEKLEALRERLAEGNSSDQDKRELRGRWADFVKETRIRIGTILKSQRISILLGAGASRAAGGPVLAHIPPEIETEVSAGGVHDEKLEPWLLAFYAACKKVSDRSMPDTEVAIRERLYTETREPLEANYERVLFALHVWEEALSNEAKQVVASDGEEWEFGRIAAQTAREKLTAALIKRCVLPHVGAGDDALSTHREMVRRLLARPTTLQRVSVFTVNYDTLIEQAADAEGAVLIDGFVGNVNRVFRPESYDYDLYFPAETTEGPIHRLDRVLQLYKLHGSVTWRSVEPSWENPFGIESRQDPVSDVEAAVIYPTPAKYGAALAMPYAELFRRLASSIVRPQSVLITIGYGFPDEHLNAIIRQALAIPSFTLIVVDPKPKSEFVTTLVSRPDQRVWMFSGELGYFEKFVEIALPDLRDSEVERKVAETFNAVRPAESTSAR